MAYSRYSPEEDPREELAWSRSELRRFNQQGNPAPQNSLGGESLPQQQYGGDAEIAQQYGKSGGSGQGSQAAMASKNPWAIAAAIAVNYLKSDEEKHRQRREFQASMGAQRAGQLGYPTYGIQGAQLRYGQTFNRPGTVGYDPMGG